ncbi:MAG: hypothetical protein EWM73_03420 [Nitrospira sp.]|nr:MAG: hypothetical protein EWM73_03420 [Nitrospira sp.]
MADPVGAMHDKWFPRRDCELDGQVAIRCLEGLCARSGRWRFGAPSIDPDVEPITRRTGFPQTGPADFLRKVEPTLTEIAHGKMGQVQLRDGPLRRQGLRLIARHATAEEGELIAEGPAVLRRELAGVVPPFGAKLIMRSVIAREGVSIAFRGDPEFL